MSYVLTLPNPLPLVATMQVLIIKTLWQNGCLTRLTKDLVPIPRIQWIILILPSCCFKCREWRNGFWHTVCGSANGVAITANKHQNIRPVYAGRTMWHCWFVNTMMRISASPPLFCIPCIGRTNARYYDHRF